MAYEIFISQITYLRNLLLLLIKKGQRQSLRGEQTEWSAFAAVIIWSGPVLFL